VDAGSIEKRGIELAVILAAAIAVVMGSSCYDHLGEGADPHRSALVRAGRKALS